MENELEVVSLETLSAVTVANAQDIEKLQQSQASIESELKHLREMVRVAFKQSGVDFEKDASFVSSRIPRHDVPVAAEPVPTVNQKLKPGVSGLIPVPNGNGGDGVNRGKSVNYAYRVDDGGAGDGGG